MVSAEALRADGPDWDEAFAHDVLTGLAEPQKRIPAKYFYDARGSQLFDRICEVEAYYPTRIETGILGAHAADMARRIGAGANLVEFGSGSSTKVRILLDALIEPAAYVPVDISQSHLLAAARALARDYPALKVVPVHADYSRDFTPPPLDGTRPVAFFPGSTIGNFSRDEAAAFLRQTAASLGAGAGLLIGVDLKKDEAILHAAYNDPEGVTAAFNLNLLVRINRELAGTFDTAAFAHRAHYNAARGCVEMHLYSQRAQTAQVCGHTFAFAVGESIHTEDSCKYAVAEFQAVATDAGWRAERVWTDAAKLFSVHYLTVV